METISVPFYNTSERCQALRREAFGWIGTPFMARGRIKGVGVDCISLCALIYHATGLLDRFDPPSYSMDGGSHLQESLLEQQIQASGRGVKIWERADSEFRRVINLPSLTMPGDLLCAKLGRVT